MKEDARSSLEKLQALEKDYGTFDQQLDALASVVGLDSRKRDTLNGSTAATHGAPQYPLGKASFALRWLLGKFQGDHVCRISPRAWQLLAQIIACLPPTTAAKFLKSSKFLRILESALEAAFPDRLEHTTEQASPKSNGDQNHSRVRSPVREKHTEEVTGLGKRKRKGTQDEEQGGKKAKRARATDSTSSGPSSITKTEITKPHGFSKHDDPAPLFLSMSFCLKKMVSPDSAQAAQQYLPALKSSPASICRIMGSWLRALRVLFSVQRSAPAEERKSALFNPALRLWHLNSHAVDTALFSSHVLLPAISLTALLAKPKPIHYKLDAEDVSVTTRDLERLIARHLLVPARRSFHDSRKSDPTTTDLDLTKLLEPISSQHRGSLGSVAKSETSQTSDSQPDLTPCLFSIALRSAPRSSVQKRLSEQPWLQGVFLALTQCLNLDSSHRSPSQSAQRLKELESMLKLAKKHDVTLTRPVLRDLTVDHGGLSTTSPEPQWSLLARIIALDQQALLDRAADTQIGQSTVLQLLFAAISSHAPLLDHSRGSERVTSNKYNIIRNGIVRPLMRAHATARDVTGFLRHWTGSLEGLEEPQSDYATSVWEDPNLKLTLSDIMEVSMTTKSIVELGSELAADLSLTELDNNSQQRCFASAQVISAILYAARSDELVEQLLPVAEGIISTTFRLLYSSRANSLRLRSALWQLLSASFHVWTSVAEGNSIMAHPVIVDRNPPLARCGEHLPRPRDVLEALSCLLGMYQDLCSRHMEVFATNLQAGIESAMHCYMSATDLSDYEVETFAAIVAKSPIVLELSQEGSKPTAVATKSILQHLAGRASHYVAAGKGTDWSLAGSMLRSTWLDVVSRIFASSYGRAQLLQTLKEGAIGDKRLHDLSLLRAPFPVEEQRRSSQIDNNTLSRLLNSTARFRVDDWICALSLLQHVSLVDSQHASPAVTFDDLQQLGQRLDSTMLAHEGVSTDSVEGIPRAWRQLCSLFEALVSDYCRRTRPTSANSRAAAASSDLASRGMSGSETHGPFSICLIKSVLTTLSLPGHLTFQETVLPGILNAARKNMHAGKLTSFALLALQQSIEAILTSPDDIYKSEYNELCVFAKKLRQLNHEKARELATALDWNTFMVRSDSSWSNALTKLAACTSHEQRNTLTKLIVGKLDKDVDNGTHALISTVLEEFHQQLDFEVAMNHMRLLHAIVFKSSRPKQEDLLPAQLVPGIVASFTERLPAVTSYKAFLYASSTLDLLLRYHTRSIDQHSIESILTSIFATSTAGPLTSDNNTTTQHNPSQALQNNVPKLYAHLTTLLQSILILHRRRLIDRSHLLLPPLQSLLRCLFAPPPSISSTKPPDFPTSQPSWLARQNPLTAENAASYARLLTTWADPSPSAVAPPRSKSRRSEGGAGKGKDESLVNHTMLARRHAGQFAPYILLELCRLQLEGRLVDESNVSSASASQGARLDGKGADEQDEDDYADEAKPQQARQSMRDALRPGVHALFDAMALVESGTDERGKRRAFVDVVARDEAGVWGVSAGVRTVLRSWWGEWRLERGLRG